MFVDCSKFFYIDQRNVPRQMFGNVGGARRNLLLEGLGKVRCTEENKRPYKPTHEGRNK